MNIQPIYLCDWADQKEMMRDFEIGTSELEGAEIILASYISEGYEGDAFVLFRKDGDLFEVHGGHCSCYGLEGQWTPEPTTIEALRHRLEKGRLGQSWYGDIFKGELTAVLATLESGA